jgi:glycosyltransferase involved in cell wall biosynthesis
MSSVSVVIPCYNYGHFLEDALSSVLTDQEGVDVRVLIIDDASPDGSASIAQDLAARDPRVEVIAHRLNRGNIATFNEGLLQWADGDYCMLMSADDRATPRALRRAADLLDAHPTVGFVYGRVVWAVEGQPVRTARTRLRGWSIRSGQGWLQRCYRQAENPINSPEVVMRTSLLHRVGAFDPSLPKAADMELFMRLAAYADVGFLRGVDQAYYRVHQESMSNTVSSLMDLRQRRSVFEVVLDRYGDRLTQTEQLYEMVHRQLGKEALWAAGRVYARGPLRRTELARRLLGVGAHEPERDVEELLGLAADCWPEVKRLALYRSVEARQPLGPRETAYLLSQKGQWWLRRRSWRYRGI